MFQISTLKDIVEKQIKNNVKNSQKKVLKQGLLIVFWEGRYCLEDILVKAFNRWDLC